MKNFFLGVFVLSGFLTAGYGQIREGEARQSTSVPLYHLTVVGRTIQAVNYGHRSEPTKIDFRGTVLLPDATGGATVRNQRGATVIDAKFERLPLPSRFGPQFLTYVLWAITPDGRTSNLGEIVLNPSDEGKLHVTTEFPAFGLMVTAEPYFSVSQPGDVVVMENRVRPDTIGKIQVIDAKYELLPRGQFTLDEQTAVAPPTKKVRMNEYEAITAVYQAQNAVQIAQSQGAERYAPEVFSKAATLLEQAQSCRESKDYKRAVMTAREAAQTAEDARVIAQQRAAAQQQIEPVRLGSSL
jgi:hypothetical protein